MENPNSATLSRPLDRLRAHLRFFFVIVAINVANVVWGSIFFVIVWWFRDWSYWFCGVRAMRWYIGSAGIKVDTVGMDKIRPDRPAIYVSSHKSHMDIPASMAAFPVRFFFIAKKELQRIPIFGWALPPLGMYMIDRSTTEKAYASIREAARRITIENQSILIYPEGGISKTGELQPFKKGAFALAIEAGVPVVPLVIHGSQRLFSMNRMVSRPGRMKIEILDEVDTSTFTSETKDQLRERVHAMMKEAENREAARALSAPEHHTV